MSPGSLTAAWPRCVVPDTAPTEGWLLDSPGCRIAALQPLSDEVRRFVFTQPAYTCDDPPPLVRSNDSHLWVERTPALVARYLNGSDHGHLDCCYSGMWRAEGPNWRADPTKLEDGIAHANDIRWVKVAAGGGLAYTSRTSSLQQCAWAPGG